MALVSIAWGCAAPTSVSPEQAAERLEAQAAAQSVRAVDDGTYLEQIDPLGGQWHIERLAGEDFTPFNGWVDFSAGGFLNHGAGCSGGFPAFYRLEGDRIDVTRLEPVRVGKCAGTAELASGTAAQRRAAGDSERRLAAFLDQLGSWKRMGGTLVLTARDGAEATLSRPVEPHPELAGRWHIETIGGDSLVTEQRPAILSISQGSIGAHADCNSFGGPFTTPTPGRLTISGPMVSTLIGCAPEDAAEDALMARAITSATSYRVEGDRLILSGGPGLVARRQASADQALAGEYEHCGNTLLGAYHKGPIELSINDRTMRDNVGCVAGYSHRGPDLTLNLDEGPACRQSAPPFVPGEPVEVGGTSRFSP